MTNKSAIKELFEGLSRLKPEEVLRYRSKLSEATLIPPAELAKRLSDFNGQENFTRLEDVKPSDKNNKKPVKYIPVEAAFCAMLFNYPELRLKIKPEEIFTLLKDPVEQQIAIAALTENTDEIKRLWLEMGELNKVEFLERGNEFLREISFKTPSELWTTIYNDIKKLALKRRNDELKEKLLSGKATSDELIELNMQY